MTNPRRQSLPGLLGKIMTMFFLAALSAVAQQQPAATPAPATDQSKPEEKKDPDAKAEVNPKTGTSDDRLGYVLPNFLTVQNADRLPPLTAGQKFKAVAKGAFDWGQFAWYGVLSGISQAQNSEPGFGQGWDGFGKRYGAAAADGTIENFMTGAILPTVFHEDPRFYQLGQGSFMHRTGYAMSRIVVTRTDSGHHQFNFSEILGSALSASISTYSYHPREDRNIRNTASVWGTQVGYDTLSLVVKEFWPDIRRMISHKRHHDDAPTK